MAHTQIKNLPRHLRPREKLIDKGPENLKDKELLAILLRTGRQGRSALDLSALILKKYPTDKLLTAGLDDLQTICGIGSDKAVTILAAFELAKRATAKFDNTLPIIDSPQKAVDQLTHIRSKAKEYFMCLYLNARNQLIHKETISIGTLDASLVHPREVFAPAITHHATAIILAHNHPSGSLEKSAQDQQVTTRLMQAGELLGIEIIDHLIVTSTDFVSFKENGWL